MINFLQSTNILDVRSPKEFEHAHIPGACNLPLFTDEERALVGTCYKKQGKEKAVELGLQIVGPKLFSLVEQAKTHGTSIGLYCARGGMRSQSVGWLLQLAGLGITPLKGGYKKFRNWALHTLSIPRNYHIIGGFTGSGKTALLNELQAMKEQVLDLEKLACHKGSSFGYQEQQPSIEYFENKIAVALSHFDPNKPIWIEDESRLIGKCKIPDSLFIQMRAAPLFRLERCIDERVEHLLQDYQSASKETLLESTRRLEKRLGKVRCDEIVSLIQNENPRAAIKLLLEYYDGTYTYGLSRRTQPITPMACDGLSFNECAKRIIYA